MIMARPIDTNDGRAIERDAGPRIAAVALEDDRQEDSRTNSHRATVDRSASNQRA